MDSSGNRVDLEGVTLRMFSKDGKSTTRSKARKLNSTSPTGLLFSEGEVEITMGVGTDPAEAAKQGAG